MASPEKIDILIMRGAGRVGRYHVAPGWLRALWLTPLVLACLLAGALAMVWRLRETNITLRRQCSSQAAEHDTVGERLLRLENIEKILRSKDLTELETLLASVNPDDPGWWKPQNGKKSLSVPAKDRIAPRPDLAALLAKVDSNQAGVDNLKMQFERRNLALHFDLSNLSPQASLSGRGDVAIITNEATLLPLKANRDDLSFQIQRFKQIAVTIPLPAKLDPKDCYALRLRVLDPADKVIYSQVFPFNRN